MKQLLILSGKGGTGKTTIASAFIHLSRAEAFADCDVDAPNLHLIMAQSEKPQYTDFTGMDKAVVDSDGCNGCGICSDHCRFDAITMIPHRGAIIDPMVCEGCGVCERICPEDAIEMKSFKAGDLMLYKDGYVFSTARLKMGSGTSGLLVTEVKKQLKRNARDAKVAIIDGSPGIGCPVIASISGVDKVLVVAEPSLSGFSDMERIVRTARGLRVPIAICVNKWDINKRVTEDIQAYCTREGIPFVGKVPFDPKALEAVNQRCSITELNCPAGVAVADVYMKTMALLNNLEACGVQFSY
jgi:MinD superfamily P-loop ATPase